MKFAVVGGDRRSAILCSMLARDGHRVCCFALEHTELTEDVQRAGCLQGCVYGADCVILPTPAEKSGVLNAPLSDIVLGMTEVIGVLWPGQILLGGKFSDESLKLAERGKLCVEDLMRRPDFTVGNAALTAEGAIYKLMENSERSLLGSEVLICGWGRIGKFLALRLAALGALVTVAERKRESRAAAEALGMRALDYTGLETEIGGFDFIINTVPARVLTDAALCMAADTALIAELASPPGGFDRNLAENIGLKTLAAPGLPGKCTPYSAAELIKKAIYDVLNEQEE